jgi:hypothetical protein
MAQSIARKETKILQSCIKILVASCFILACPAQAQHALVLQKLNEWNDAAHTPPMDDLKQAVLTKAQAIYGSNETCDLSQMIIDNVQPATADRYVFNSVARRSLRNGWSVATRLPGCDAAPVRFMVMQGIDDSLNAIRVNRGKSHAWDSLFVDLLPIAYIGADARLKADGIECDSEGGHALGVVRVVSESDDLGEDIFGVRYKGSWQEVWPVLTCGRSVEISVEFTADGDGGAYHKVTIEPDAVLEE